MLGKAKIAQQLGINILVDDSPEIGGEANQIGLGFVGIALEWRDRDRPHWGVKVRNLEEAVDLIYHDPDRYYTADR